ncbi:Periplasmic septal ring factor with murein hydrolase activity EnvC/YibP [Myxococcus hansupus]|uniref:Periplasmic septal ring factor with murein hydrolase activity EnvC/YibP n=1 Tax=Pseudomyxococcus hansupus TaxID=1297742 RepID=A0A0H4WSB2_9BACT|nr:peptidoglycan DD-metalloendopeptidase family protein [Myxococcus hansupus]AKQ64250.1 Periplasmic septal ring factor with murein hydrolase activity EnvC/YibP [Myxococcus hansupus]
MSRGLLLLALGLCASTALAAAPARVPEESEQAALRERLAAQRATLALVEAKKLSVLEGVEMMQEMAAFSRRRVRSLEGDLAVFRRRVLLAEREQAVLAEALTQQLRRLSPRLRTLYRLMRRRPLEVLLSAEDFAALVWRARALEASMSGDLELLRTVQRVARLQRQATRELGRLQASLAARMAFLQEQERLARLQQEGLEEVVGTLAGEAELARRAVRELEQADAELTRVVKDLKELPATSGFGALRGKLPRPVQGVVEVGFGKVINPRFNTVTVQKGLDIRAAPGTPVQAVAEGTVAYAGSLRGYGKLLILDHGDGYHTLMAHLSAILPELGAMVLPGDVVGEVGDTGSLKGAYLYFEVRKGGQAVDPALWLTASP